ncbi:uncharacterized protein LOC142741323 [Rhinoderma darwinii]|uniref:uncharacterized protein LOC142741323 n=1 Tax=Rhinoderma darwinii TaxID=43563 RepID=UPI003F663474
MDFHIYYLLIIDDVKTRWRSCRDQFRREYGARGRSGDGASKKRKYIYTQQLMFLKDIMEMRPCSDNLLDTEEEAGHEEAHAPQEQNPLLPLTPEATAPEPSPQASEMPETTAAARRRRSHMGSACAQVDSRVIEYLRRCAEEDGCDAFGRSIAPLLRRVPDHRMARLQGSIISLIDSATPPNNPCQCFQAMEYWRGLSVPFTAAGPSQPATPLPRQHYHRPMPSRMSPVPVQVRDRPLPAYSRPEETFPHVPPHGYHTQHQHHYAVEEHPLQAHGQHSGAEMGSYNSPPHRYQQL